MRPDGPGDVLPEKGGTTLPAKRVCTACPVEVECVSYALVRDERFGVWGNTSPEDRRKIRARLGMTDTTHIPEGDATA